MKLLKQSLQFLSVGTLAFYFASMACPAHAGKVKEWAGGINAAENSYRSNQLKALFQNKSQHTIFTAILREEARIVMLLESKQTLWPGATNKFLLQARKQEQGYWMVERLEEKTTGSPEVWEKIAEVKWRPNGVAELRLTLVPSEQKAILRVAPQKDKILAVTSVSRPFFGGALKVKANFLFDNSEGLPVPMYLTKMAEGQAYQFEERPIYRPSVKNMILEHEWRPYVQFVADKEADLFHLDFKAPVAPAQAFSLAVAILAK
ncbi:MAG: hypothetical protein HYW48_09905 [Deltaproteobacteria bacterium]|nr:hypothetical protein [Deltaproteobacteria bacterium]